MKDENQTTYSGGTWNFACPAAGRYSVCFKQTDGKHGGKQTDLPAGFGWDGAGLLQGLPLEYGPMVLLENNFCRVPQQTLLLKRD